MPSAFVRYLLILNVAISIYYKISIAILKTKSNISPKRVNI